MSGELEVGAGGGRRADTNFRQEARGGETQRKVRGAEEEKKGGTMPKTGGLFYVLLFNILLI